MDKSITDFNVRLRTIKIRNLIVGIILTAIITAILMTIFPEIVESDELFFIVFLFIGALMFVWALRGTRGLEQNIENVFEENNLKEILYVFVINLLFAFLFTFLISSLDILIGLTDPTWITTDIETVDVDSSIVILDAIGAIILAPIIEELVFRGVLFNRLKIRTGIIPAMIISSFIFAIGHEFGGMTSAFLFGICMCILYLKTDNILIPMGVHFLNNTVATILNLIGLDMVMTQLPWIVPCTIISIIGSIYLIKYIIKECRQLKKEHS
ncbi:CPBP family intramembrane glutamic endopeptidase [Methanobrevibacter sp.]|uniref:CPBP family intramembrane glutamic endopeptidase n=1 Tax=Methanobrevibacter sp. TaxID=66852 RepID=UPI002E7748C7|nr:CPBP family intramembrane glutamic endopeptidase [Methanobrevibacter sp.]MEE1336448.1 CPBP family intramembrane glutamic endopeptidase [Methanobrevibacter sp.]